jgi:hypothetical protein
MKSTAYRIITPDFLTLSYFSALKRSAIFDPSRGVAMENMLDVIDTIGQPLESAWPYIETLPTSLASYKPPDPIGDLYGVTTPNVKNRTFRS